MRHWTHAQVLPACGQWGRGLIVVTLLTLLLTQLSLLTKQAELSPCTIQVCVTQPVWCGGEQCAALCRPFYIDRLINKAYTASVSPLFLLVVSRMAQCTAKSLDLPCLSLQRPPPQLHLSTFDGCLMRTAGIRHPSALNPIS